MTSRFRSYSIRTKRKSPDVDTTRPTPLPPLPHPPTPRQQHLLSPQILSPPSPNPSLASTLGRKIPWKDKLAFLNPSARRTRKQSVWTDSTTNASPRGHSFDDGERRYSSDSETTKHSPVSLAVAEKGNAVQSAVSLGKTTSDPATIVIRPPKAPAKRKAIPVFRGSSINPQPPPPTSQPRKEPSPPPTAAARPEEILSSRSSSELNSLLEQYRHSSDEEIATVPVSASLTPLQLLRSSGYLCAGMLRDEQEPLSCAMLQSETSCEGASDEPFVSKVSSTTPTTLLQDECAPFDLSRVDSVMSLAFESHEEDGVVSMIESEEDDRGGFSSIDWPLPPKRSFLIVGDTAEMWIESDVEYFTASSPPLDSTIRHVVEFPREQSAFQCLPPTQLPVSHKQSTLHLSPAQLQTILSHNHRRRGDETPRPTVAALHRFDADARVDEAFVPAILRIGVIVVLASSWRSLSAFWERNASTVVVDSEEGLLLEVKVMEEDDRAGGDVRFTCVMQLKGPPESAATGRAKRTVAKFNVCMPVTLAEVGKRCARSAIGEGVGLGLVWPRRRRV